MKKTVRFTTQDPKAIKAALKLDGTIFNVKGHTSQKRSSTDPAVWERVPEEFKTSMHISEYGDRMPLNSFSQNHPWASSMNVKRFGSLKVSLYTVTAFGKVVKQSIPYSSITIVSVKAQPTENQSVAQPSDNQPVKTA
jgi:cytochrome c556